MAGDPRGSKPSPLARKRKKAAAADSEGAARPVSHVAQDLVNALTTSVATELDAAKLRLLKHVARASEEGAGAVFDAALAKTRTRHAQVRLLALLIIDSLVMRSRVFRARTVASLPTLLPLMLGDETGLPLPPPAARARLLKERALECLQRWVLCFGAHAHYTPLILARRYVQTSLRLKLPDLRARASARERDQLQRRESTQLLLASKFQQLQGDLPGSKAEMEAAVAEVRRLLGLLETHSQGTPTPEAPPDGVMETECGDEEEGDLDVEGGVSLLRRQAALASVDLEERTQLLEQRQAALPAVFAALQEQLTLIDKSFLPTTAKWLSTLSRFGDMAQEVVQARDALLKEAIDVRAALRDARESCHEAGVDLPVPAEEELAGRDGGGAAAAGASEAAAAAAAAAEPAGEEAGEELEWETDNGAGPAAELEQEGDSGLGGNLGMEGGFLREGDEIGGSSDVPSMPEQDTGGASLPPPDPFSRDPTLPRETRTGELHKQQKKEKQGKQGKQAQARGGMVQLAAGSGGKGQGAEGPEGSGEEREEGRQKQAKRQHLREAAPVVPWGMHLEYWGAGEDAVPVNSKGMSFDNHWGPVDETVCLPAERVQQLTLMCTTYRPPVSKPPGGGAGTGPHAGCSEAKNADDKEPRDSKDMHERTCKEGSVLGEPDSGGSEPEAALGAGSGARSPGLSWPARSARTGLDTAPMLGSAGHSSRILRQGPMDSLDAGTRIPKAAGTAGQREAGTGPQSVAGAGTFSSELDPSALLQGVARQAVKNVRAEDAKGKHMKAQKEASGSGSLGGSRMQRPERDQAGRQSAESQHGRDRGSKGSGLSASVKAHNDRVLHMAALLECPERAAPGEGTSTGIGTVTGAGREAQRKEPSAAAQLRAMLKSPDTTRRRLQVRAEKLRRKGK